MESIVEVTYGDQAIQERGPGPVHETVHGLTEAGVMARRTMKVFDSMCLTPVEEMTAETIRALWLQEHANRAFARYLNVTTGLVPGWERSEKRPRGASLKLLTLVAKNGLGTVA